MPVIVRFKLLPVPVVAATADGGCSFCFFDDKSERIACRTGFPCIDAIGADGYWREATADELLQAKTTASIGE